MTLYVVLDTNVLVSSMLKPESIPGQVVDHALHQDIVPVLSDEIIDEYSEILHRQKFKFSESKIADLIKGLDESGVYLSPTETDELFLDLSDVVFYEVTLTAKEHHDAFLVTGNIKDFPVKPFVVTPREMLDIIESAADSNRYGA